MNAVEWLRTLGPVLGSVPQTKILGSGAEEIARRWEQMEEAIEDCLATAKADWDNVARHPASRFRKDVEYYTTLLAMAQAPIDKETT